MLDLSLVGYVAAVLAVFGLLLLRFRLAIAGAVTLATVFLPALVEHSSYPLTDSWGLALETAALACGLLVLERGSRWLIPWTALILAALVHARQHLDSDPRRRLAHRHVEVEGCGVAARHGASPRRSR